MKRLPWIVQMGPRYNHMYPYKREAYGDQRQAQEEEQHADKGEGRVLQPQVKGLPWAPAAGKTGEGSSQATPGGGLPTP